MMSGAKNIVKNMIQAIGNVGKSVLRGEHMQRWEAFNNIFGTNDSLEKQINQIYEIMLLEHRRDKNFDENKLRKLAEEWLKEEDMA